MVVNAYIRSHGSTDWQEYNDSFDFYASCDSCNGQIKIQKPEEILEYQPFKDYEVKVNATDEKGFGNTEETRFNL